MIDEKQLLLNIKYEFPTFEDKLEKLLELEDLIDKTNNDDLHHEWESYVIKFQKDIMISKFTWIDKSENEITEAFKHIWLLLKEYKIPCS